MHDEKDFPEQLGDIDNDEIEIEFVDVDDDPAPAAPEPEAPAGVEVTLADEMSPVETEKLQAELDHVRDVYLRKLAEFDNFRKRVEREREEIRQAALEDFIRELLPVVDNFERALQHAEDDGGAFHQGVEMIAKQLHDTLERKGVQQIDPVGESFNPEVHEAVQRVEGVEHAPGTIVFVMLKGYSMGDRLIRPAMVGVAVEPSDGDAEPGGAQ